VTPRAIGNQGSLATPANNGEKEEERRKIK